MPLMFLPPGPMMRPIFSVGTFREMTLGAKSEMSLRGCEMVWFMIPRMCSRPSRACPSAFWRISALTPSILMSICRAVMPSSVPATLKSMSPR